MTINRRRFLLNGALGLGGLIVAERTYDFFSESKAKAKILIVGGGAAGITMAAYLTDKLRTPDITIVEPNETHFYQPGYTLIASGIFSPEQVTRSTGKLIPRGVKWVKDSVAELVPDANYVTTQKSGKIDYDFLVLTPGCQMNFDLIEGISRETLGEGNAHCIYDYQGAIKYHRAMEKLTSGRKDARLVFTDTYTKLKCGGAPKKICLITEDFLRDKEIRDGFDIQYFGNSTNLMTPVVFGDRLQQIYDERNIGISYKHRLVSVDTSAKNAVFQQIEEATLAPLPVDDTKLITVDYDLLHFIPPMSAPDFVKNSPLAITTGDLRHGGWADVDNATLVHTHYKNIMVVGDAGGLRTSKTGAAIRMQAPVAAANLVSIMEGNEPEETYNGYSACPIVTEYGKVLMCEFGYEKELMPTIPWLDPAVERGMWWMLKVHGLEPMYYHGMLKGLM
ncbi:MAG: NAD(P)/FAD-dependent oxidoreductase [Draconibacterium sp.]